MRHETSFLSLRFMGKLLAALLAALLMLSFPLTSARAEGDATYRFGTVEEYSTYAPGEMLSDSFAWSDSWFFEAPEDRNDSLALASMQLTAVAVEEGSDGNSAAFLRNLGFEQVGFERFESADPDDCAYTWGTKTIDDGSDSYTLVAVAIQSYSFDSQAKSKGWRQNFILNDESAGVLSREHLAFSRAADKVVGDIAALGGSGKVKYWIVGQSRGGALVNLIAAKLPGMLGSSNGGVYAYTFESPATVDADAIADAGSYAYIHNYRCSDDIVTRIPLWGMTVYGATHELKTEETDANLVSELSKLGSAAAEVEVPDIEGFEAPILAALEAQAPTRADYSRKRFDSFLDAAGEEVDVTYSYQDTLVSLMGSIFGGELEGISSDAAIERIGEISPSLLALGDALVKEEAAELSDDEMMPYYWEAAKALRGLVVELSPKGDVSMTDTDFYALLRLIAHYAYDTGYVCTGNVNDDLLGYLSPLVLVVANAQSFVYSHHFDTLIARLKTMAPQVPMDDVNISIEVPAAGDSSGKAPGEVIDFVASLGNSWLTAEAAWQGEDDPLANDSVHYLDVTLHAVGHVAPEGLQVTINGAKSVGNLDVSYSGGASVIRGTWEFIIGSPKDVTVSFDTAGHGEAPKAMNVPEGTLLRYVDVPEFVNTVTEDGITWKFGGWRGDDGTAWDGIVALQDLTVHAKWLRVVDDVRITFAIPKVGERAAEPIVPEGAPYYVSSFNYIDGDWNDVETFETPGTYTLECYVSLVDPENSVFALEGQDEVGYDYVGSVTVNGDNPGEVGYDEDGYYLRVYSNKFEVTEAEPESVTYAVVEGAGQTWAKGSLVPAKFVVKRSVDDEETFGRFVGIEIDGMAVAPEAFVAEEGSAIISINPAYLESLSVGKHSLAVQFDDGLATTDFTVQEQDEKHAVKPDKRGQKLPQTGDGTSEAWWVVLASVGLTMLAGGLIARGKAGAR